MFGKVRVTGRVMLAGLLLSALLAPAAAAAPTVAETVGGNAHTWTNPANAGGTEGPTIPAYTTVQIACKLVGFRVANGNTWWYRIASSPWNSTYYVSADAFYNNGATSGSLVGTPWVDPAVPDCGSASAPAPSVTLAQGPAAPAGYRYAVTLAGFAANASVSVRCFDSVSPGGFFTFSIRTDGSGHASPQSYCYSGDGPDHWVTANEVQSNHVSWRGSTGGGSLPPTTPLPSPTLPPPTFEHCAEVQGERFSGTLMAETLFAHYLNGNGRQVVIDFSYFASNADFVAFAKSLDIGIAGSRLYTPPKSDMFFGFGTITVTRTTEHCYYVYDRYDFNPDKPRNRWYIPLWLIPNGKLFISQSSGKLS